MSGDARTSAPSKASRVPRALATPTDLNPDAAAAVTAAVNPLVADAFALYVKTKNFHWHLSGPRFRDYHLLFDEQAAVVLDSIDVLARTQDWRPDPEKHRAYCSGADDRRRRG